MNFNYEKPPQILKKQVEISAIRRGGQSAKCKIGKKVHFITEDTEKTELTIVI